MSQANASGSQKNDDADIETEAGDELQFDQAEYATPGPAGPSCGVCKRSIDDVYFEINGKVICQRAGNGSKPPFAAARPWPD